jgi:phenylacetate-CoA ligase
MGEGQIMSEYFNPVIEKMSAEEISAFQWDRLRAQIHYVYRTNPFYQRIFRERGITPKDIRSFQDYSTMVPVTTKKDILRDLEEHPPYGQRLGISPERIYQVVLTGGTSGSKQEVHALTHADVELAVAGHIYGCYWAGIRRADVVADTTPVGTTGGGLWLYRSLSKQHVNLFSLGAMDTPEKLEFMKRFNMTVLQATPSYLLRFEKVAAEMGMDFRKDFSIRKILLVAEPYSQEWAEEREVNWGAKIYEWYGNTQKAIAWTCRLGVRNNRKPGVLHHLSPFVYFETIDRDTGEQVGPGEEGEIVTTHLFSEASPILRFATNDKGLLVSGRDCGCGLPFDGYRIGSICRYDDMLKIKGVNLWPQVVDDIIFGFKEIVEYKGRAFNGPDGKEEITVSVEFVKNIPDSIKREIIWGLSDRLREETGIRMNLDEAAEHLPEFKDARSKARRWRDERKR